MRMKVWKLQSCSGCKFISLKWIFRTILPIKRFRSLKWSFVVTLQFFILHQHIFNCCCLIWFFNVLLYQILFTFIAFHKISFRCSYLYFHSYLPLSHFSFTWQLFTAISMFIQSVLFWFWFFALLHPCLPASWFIHVTVNFFKWRHLGYVAAAIYVPFAFRSFVLIIVFCWYAIRSFTSCMHTNKLSLLVYPSLLLLLLLFVALF